MFNQTITAFKQSCAELEKQLTTQAEQYQKNEAYIKQLEQEQVTLKHDLKVIDIENRALEKEHATLEKTIKLEDKRASRGRICLF
jgi:septal ring factor EnvC (AmiA/AmiB activator)